MPSALAAFIEHTLLKPEATATDIEQLCGQAVQYGFRAVCVNPYWVSRAVEMTRNSDVAVCTVVGFPLGSSVTKVKSIEAEQALSSGADEVDMVLNVGALRGGDFAAVEADIRGVREATTGHVLKVIVEASALNETELGRAVELAVGAGADFIKTSTGFHPSGGARIADVERIKKVLGDAPVGIKASGGIREYDFALRLISAGATRLGASSGVSLVEAERASERAS